jgi:tetratricopeptide (TPR) repeat protein
VDFKEGVMNRCGNVALMLILTLAPTVAAAKRPRPTSPQPMSSPADIIKRMEASKTQYLVRPLNKLEDVPASEFAAKLWPARGQATELPFLVKQADGGVDVVRYRVSEEAVKALSEADAFYQKKDYASAETAYLDVTNRFPDWYRAHLYLADVYFERGDNLKALAGYREAIRLNPYDYVGFLFEGHALAKLGRTDEAIEAWVRALSLRAYQETTLKIAAQFANQLGITPHAERFQPKAFVRREGDTVVLYVDPDAVHWLSWAGCKAVWLGEPDYRKARGVSGDDLWSSTEDDECLAHLLIMYGDERKQGKTPAEPALDRLLGLFDDHMLDDFVLYEFGSRISPDALLLTSGADQIPAFVRKYVLPKTVLAAKP